MYIREILVFKGEYFSYLKKLDFFILLNYNLVSFQNFKMYKAHHLYSYHNNIFYAHFIQ